MEESDEVPGWAKGEVYPPRPDDAPFGALSRKGRRTFFESFEALAEHVRGSRESVVAVWSPDCARMVPPEALPSLLEPLRRRLVDLAESDMADARRNTLVFGLLLGWAVYAALANRKPPQDSMEVGLAALLLLGLGLVPCYDAWKAKRKAWNLDEEALASEEEEARFEQWLGQQRTVATRALIGLLGLVGLVQIWVGLEDSVRAAGLVKASYQAGDWWRILTSPFLHGHPLHWLLNALGLWYLGRRVEALASWPHLVLAFLTAMVAGGMATARMMPQVASVGASGGLLGLLGFLIVFETLHPRLVPHPTRKRLLGALLLTFLVGFVGYRFIDNWAHAGGLVAGLLYAAIVFPPSRSARRPRAHRLDQAGGVLASLFLTASALLAAWLMIRS